MQNGFVESFNGRRRDECSNGHWCMSRDDACSKMEDWRRYYNEERPHSRIRQMTPILLHKPGVAFIQSLVKKPKTQFSDDPRFGLRATLTTLNYKCVHIGEQLTRNLEILNRSKYVF